MKAPEVRDEVRAFHSKQVIVDLHVDMVLQHFLFGYNISKRHRPFMRRQPLFWHTDIPRMLEGGYSAAILGIHYWPWESKRAVRTVRRQLDYIDHVIGRDERVTLARSAGDIEAAHKAGQLALLSGMEGAHMLGGQLTFLEEASQRGVAYLTLTHFSKNSSSTPGLGRKRNQNDGLSGFGRELIAELNRVQILVDVAHINRPGVVEACEHSIAPVIASHTTASGVHEHNRGLADDGLDAVAATGGVVGVMFSPGFLRGRLNASLDAVVDHIIYIADRIGARHVAVGTDFDGWIPTIPNDIRDCRDLPLLTQRLLDRGMPERDVSGILGANVLRVLREVRDA